MSKINDVVNYGAVVPAAGDLVIGTDVSDVSTDAGGETVNFLMSGIKAFVAGSPALTGTPTAPTATTGTDTTQIATTAFVADTGASYATAAQGDKADTALQNASAFATAAQGVKADGSALAPTASAGVGHWRALGSAVSLSLPAGGTWAYFWLQTNNSGGGALGQSAGVAAGGTSIAGPASGSTFRGFAWRIA